MSPPSSADSPPIASPLGDRSRLRRLLALARPELWTLVLGTIFLAVGSVMGLAYPEAVRYLLDDALLQGEPGVVDQATLALLCVFGIQGLATAARYALFTIAGERVVTQLRKDLFAGIMGQEIAFFDERRTGELTSRLAADTGVLQNTVSVNISMVLRSLATCVGGAALMAYTSPRLAFLVVLIVPPVVVGAVVAGRWVRRYSRQLQDSLARAGEVAEESISGIRTVRAFAREEDETRRYGDAVQAAFALAVQRIRFAGWFQGIASFAGFGALAVVLGYGGHLVLDKTLSVGALTAFILYTGIVAVALGTLASLWTDFMRAVGAGDRVFDLLDRLPAIPLRGGLRPSTVAGSLKFRGVRFAYPSRKDVTVLHDLELELEAGERVALVGPSGSGKSTIAALIPRFYDPGAGSITLDGTDLRQLDPGWLRERIGIVAQEPILFSTTIADNIAYGYVSSPGGTDAALASIEAAARTANADTFVRGFPQGYDTMVGERGVQLSGGQKQRIAIARAVLRDPRILILDEATSALDAESEHLVKEALERLMQGRTTLIIAHRLSTVLGADRVVVLDGGRVVQVGPHAELMRAGDGLYRRLVERQFVGA